MNRRQLLAGIPATAVIPRFALAEERYGHLDRYNWPKGRTVFEDGYQHNNYGSVRWTIANRFEATSLLISDMKRWSDVAQTIGARRAIVFLRPDLYEFAHIQSAEDKQCRFAVFPKEMFCNAAWSIYNADEPWWNRAIKDPDPYFVLRFGY